LEFTLKYDILSEGEIKAVITSFCLNEGVFTRSASDSQAIVEINIRRGI
jgi:hypothetical protein